MSGRGGDNRSAKRKLVDDARMAQVVEMTLRGMTGPAIGAELGICKQRVHQIRNRAIDLHRQIRVGAPAKRLIRREVRIAELDCLRLDKMLEGLTKKLETVAFGEDGIEFRGGAYEGCIAAVETVLKLSAERRKWREYVARLENILKPADVNMNAGAMVLHVGPMAAKAIGALPEGSVIDGTLDGQTH